MINRKFVDLSGVKFGELTAVEYLGQSEGISFGRGSTTTASLDRIDSSSGYGLENIQWLHKDINIMKNVHSQDYFLSLCKKVAANG